MWKMSQYAYLVAIGLSTASIVSGFEVLFKPLLINRVGQSITMWTFRTRNHSIQFPDQQICYNNQLFCANWRTGSFLLTLALIFEILAIMAIVFSWALHHRKKTVVVVKALTSSSVLVSLLGVMFFQLSYRQVHEVLVTDQWRRDTGWIFMWMSLIINFVLFAVVLQYGHLVRRDSRVVLDDWTSSSYTDGTGRVYDSDDSDDDLILRDDDNISVPDDIPSEQIDFYIFNKRARREELARRMR